MGWRWVKVFSYAEYGDKELVGSYDILGPDGCPCKLNVYKVPKVSHYKYVWVNTGYTMGNWMENQATTVMAVGAVITMAGLVVDAWAAPAAPGTLGASEIPGTLIATFGAVTMGVGAIGCLEGRFLKWGWGPDEPQPPGEYTTEMMYKTEIVCPPKSDGGAAGGGATEESSGDPPIPPS